MALGVERKVYLPLQDKGVGIQRNTQDWGWRRETGPLLPSWSRVELQKPASPLSSAIRAEDSTRALEQISEHRDTCVLLSRKFWREATTYNNKTEWEGSRASVELLPWSMARMVLFLWGQVSTWRAAGLGPSLQVSHPVGWGWGGHTGRGYKTCCKGQKTSVFAED